MQNLMPAENLRAELPLRLVRDAPTQRRIAVVMLNWNQFADTAECLRSLADVKTPRFTTVVLDNGSRDNSPADLAEAFPGVYCMCNARNFGFAEGNNVGIRAALAAGADYVLLLNNDTVVRPDFLEAMIEAAEERPRCGILGGCLMYYDDPTSLWCLGGYLRWPWAGMRTVGRGKAVSGTAVERFDYVSGALMLVRRAVFEEIGLLNPAYFLNWEDTEFCERARRAGWEVLATPRAVVLHKVSRATAGTIATYYTQRNRLLFTRQYVAAPVFWAVVVPFHFARLLQRTAAWLLRRRAALAAAAWRGTLDFFRRRTGEAAWLAEVTPQEK